MALCFSLAALASVATAAEPGSRVTSTVKADARTGRLVRRVAVVSKDPQTPAEKAPERLQSQALQVLIDQTATEHRVDPLLVHSVIQAESNYNPYAVSPKGAEGLMQLIPATARRFGVQNSFDVKENLTAGVKYLKYLQELFKDDRLAIAAYNAGEGAVLRYGNVPPYKETEQYVKKVGRSYGDARKKVAPAVVAQAEAKPAVPPAPVEEPLRQVEATVDSEGRMVLRTK